MTELISARPDPDWLAANGWQIVEDDGFIKHVGPFWLSTENGATRLGFIADNRHRNRLGNVQGGMIATLCDRALGTTIRLRNGNIPSVTVQLDLHYIDPTRIGEFVEARCKIVKRSRRLAFLEAEVFSNERLTAIARGVWKATAAPAEDSAAPR